MQTLDALAFRYRAPLLVLAAAPLVWAGLDGPIPHAAALAGGAVLVALGAALRLASIRWLGKRARVSRAKATILVARGPYARVRNPLYVAALLIIAGGGLMTGLGWWALAPVAAVWLVYDRVVRHEERTLVDTHGEFGTRYLRTVPRWLPLRAPFADAPEVEREPWPEVLRREWRLVAGLPVAVAALVALALTPLGPTLREQVAALAGALGLSVPVFVVVGAVVGAVGNAIKTEYYLARKARQRALLAPEQQQGAPGDAVSVAPPPEVIKTP